MDLIHRVYIALGWTNLPPPPDTPGQTLCAYWANNGGFDLRFNSINGTHTQRECAAILDRLMLSILRVRDYRAHPCNDTTHLLQVSPDEELIVFVDDPRCVALALQVAETWQDATTQSCKKK